ncbi:hypothetical protein BH20CHL3_BH20CHL3_05000 [soil metagenome]
MTNHIHSVVDLAHLLKVIADETRLRILGAISAEPRTGKELAALLDLTPPTISHHMRKLTAAGIVLAERDAQRQWYRLNAEFMLEARRTPLVDAGAPLEAAAAGDDDEDARFRAKVIRDFFVGEHLKELPAQRKRRVIVLQHLTFLFDSDRTYKESEVNDLLRPAWDDVATLRRELVDYGFMQRDRGIYQLTRAAPERSKLARREITGNELEWFGSIVARAVSFDSDKNQG